MGKPCYEKTLEEIEESRAGTIEYYDYNGRTVKREWDERGQSSSIYQWVKNHTWVPRPKWQEVVNFYGENLTSDEVKNRTKKILPNKKDIFNK